jgi:N-methylhydantoinase B
MSDTAHQGSDVWEDFVKGYVPDDELDIHPALELNEDAVEIDDPVTYEVLRHRLWTVNYEHGETINHISGSPAAYYSQDFNPTILTADGELVFGGPYVTYFTGTTEPLVKWILENYGGNPGIEPGDMFLANDPWIGTTHQPDVSLCMPVFHDDKLFCWVVDTMHQYDIGGITPGSFCPGADDIFDDPTPIPPVKIVEGGELRQDLRYMYLRRSRLPAMVGLDFNAQIAANRDTKEKIEQMMSEYGHRTVKGAMHRIIEDSETSFLEKLEDIPDGTWRSRAYDTGPGLPCDGVYKGAIQLTKEGNTLTIRNEGTAENVGSINLTYAAFRATVGSIINTLLMYDQLWVPSGAMRHIQIDTKTGTTLRAEHPSATSPSAASTILFSLSLLQDAFMRMLSTSDRTRDALMSDQSNGCLTISQAGIDQWGNPFGTINLDTMGGGFPARTHRDGVDVGGHLVAPKGIIPNIEQNEQDYPMLYLTRSEATDAAGHGRHRGGAGLETSWIPYDTEQIETVTFGSGDVAPLTMGVGGYPGAPIRTLIGRNTDAREKLDQQTIPQDLEELDDDPDKLSAKAETVQNVDDVVEIRYPSTAGYGDPLERPPGRVVDDVEKGLITMETAGDVYGVVLTESDGDLLVDGDATEDRREERIKERLEDTVITAEEDEP